MATVIKIKKSTGSTAPTALGNGELAYTQDTGSQANGGYRLFVGAGTESGGEADHIDIVGGKYFTDLMDHAHGTLTASSGIITDSNSKVSQMIIDNIDINSNTISTTDTNGDLILSPHGSGDVDVNTSKIINVTDPTAAQDAATKAYVDAVSSGLDVKGSCVLATTAALAACTYANGTAGVGATLTADANGALSVDGVAVAAADRILVKNQAAAAQNGIYTVSATGSGGAAFVLTRATDADTSTEFNSGAFVFVEKGTANADNGYVMTQDTTITFGSTTVTFDQFSGAGQITAGAALTKTGNQMDVAVDDSSIEVSSDALRVKSNWVGQNSITTLGTITTGIWTGTSIADANVDNDLTISGGTVNASVIGGTTPAAGTFTTLVANTSLTATTADINAGTVDAVVGGTTPAAGTFTTLTANDQLVVAAGATITGDTTDEITLNVKGVDSQTAALMTVELSNGTDKLAVSAAGVTTAASLVATTADINAGTIDATAIGGTTAAAGAFTTVSATTAIPVGSGGTGLAAVAKGSLLVANTADTLSALDGGGSADGVAFYTASSDTIAWATSLDGGSF